MALKGFLPPSSYNRGDAIVKASPSFALKNKTVNLKPKVSAGGALVKSVAKQETAQKSSMSQGKGGALVRGKGSALIKADKKEEDQIIRVKVKVLKVRDIFNEKSKNQKLKDKAETKEKTNEERKNREKELEGRKKSNKFNIGGFKSILPKTGLFDWITNFLFYTILGYLNNRFEILPKLIGLIPLLAKAMDFIVNIGGMLLNGLVTFVDFGYGLVDKTRGFIKAIGGDGAAKAFDKFLGTLNTLFNLALIAAMINAGGGFGGKGGKGGVPKGAKGGRPRVTTSGGRPAGRPDIRNPFRQKPSVTTSGGRPAGRPEIRNPLRAKPKVTGSGAGPRLPKLPKGLKGKGGLIGMALLIPDLVESGMLASQGRGKDGLRTFLSALAGVGAGTAAGAATVAGAGALGITGVGLPAAIGLALASIGVGSAAGSVAYNATDSGLRKIGLQDIDPKTGKPYAYAMGGVIGKAGAGLPGMLGALTLPSIPRLTLPKLVPTLIGNAIGGVKKFLGFFGVGSEEEAKTSSEPLIDLANKVKDIPLIGGAMYAALQLALGMRVDRNVLRFVGAQFTNFSNLDAFKGVSSSVSRLTSALKFEQGGEVTSTVVSLSNSDNMKSINSLATYLDREIGSIELEIEEEKKQQEGVEETGPTSGPSGSQFEVTGGNADFWTLVAIAALEDSDPQGRADVAQSIYNRVASGVYGAKNIQGIVTRDGQYEPTWKYPYAGRKGKPNKEWYNIKDAASAARATGMSVGEMNSVAAAIRNSKYQKEAASFVGGRTDFMGGSNQPGPGDVRRKENSPNNFFGWFVGPAAIAYGKKNPGPAVTPQLGDIAVMETKSKEKKEFSIFDPSTWLTKGKDEDKGGGTLGGKGNFIQGNSGQSRGVHFHIGPGRQTENTILQSKYNADARASAAKVVDYFLKRKSTVYDGRRGVYYKSSKEVLDAQKAHTATGSQGGIDLQVDFEKPHKFPLDTFGLKYRPNGFGASADITGSNSFVAHARYDEKGKKAPQELMTLYQGGGYIGKNPKTYGGINQSASYEQTGTMIMIQPMIVEKPVSRPISYGSGMSKTTFAGSGSVNSGYNPVASRG